MPVHREHIGQVVVDDDGARDFVAQGTASVAAQLGAGDEAHVVGAAVVFDDFAFAFNEFLGGAWQRVALLAEERTLARLGRDDARLVAVGILAHIQPRTAQHYGALGHHHPAREDAGLFDFIVPQRIGLDVHGLAAVGLFSPRRAKGAGQGCKHKEGGNAMFHGGHESCNHCSHALPPRMKKAR